MGYSTDFEGRFDIDTALSPEQIDYLNAFADTRRMARNESVENLHDPARKAVGLPCGKEGEFFVGGKGMCGQEHDDSVINYNGPPCTQPGLWCKWVPTDDGLGIEWSGAEKFYDYIVWLEYMIENFLKPWGKTLSGRVLWRGEDMSDVGTLHVDNNVVEAVDIDLDSPAPPAPETPPASNPVEHDYVEMPDGCECPKNGIYFAKVRDEVIEIRDGVSYVLRAGLITHIAGPLVPNTVK